MLEGSYLVQWVGRQAVVRLPGNIDLLNAGSIGEELLALISRGAAALIVDMTETASCDDAGAEALVHAYRRAAASGTQLRLVAPAGVVRRALSLNGLDRLVPVYPCREAAVAAEPPVAQAARPVSQDLLGAIASNLFRTGLSMQAALDAAREAGRQHIMDAQQCVDEAIQEIRDHLFVVGREILPSPKSPDGTQ